MVGFIFYKPFLDIVWQYEEHGENFLDMLDGMFSFVLLDTRDKSFIAARDAIGITPLYIGWGLDGKNFLLSFLFNNCYVSHMCGLAILFYMETEYLLKLKLLPEWEFLNICVW